MNQETKILLKQAVKYYSDLLWIIKNPNKHLNQKLLKYSSLEWQELLGFVYKNKLTFYLNHLIKCNKCNRKIDHNITAGFYKIYLEKFFITQRQNLEKEKLNKLFKKNKISVLLLKNVEHLLPKNKDTVLHDHIDLDLLCYPKDFQKIDKILLHQGYFVAKTTPPHSKSPREYEYHHKESPLLLLELKLTPLEAKENNLCYLNRQQVTKLQRFLWCGVNKSGLCYLSMERELVYLLVHFIFKDKLQGLRGLYHIVQLIDRPGVDITIIEKKLKSLNLHCYFIFILSLTQKVYNISMLGKIFTPFSMKLAVWTWNPPFSSIVLSPRQRKNKGFARDIKTHSSLICGLVSGEFRFADLISLLLFRFNSLGPHVFATVAK